MNLVLAAKKAYTEAGGVLDAPDAPDEPNGYHTDESDGEADQ